MAEPYQDEPIRGRAWSAQQQSARVRQRVASWRAEQGVGRQILGGIVLLMIVGFVAIALVLSLLVGVVVALVAGALAGLNALGRRLRGERDTAGRRNVRVMAPKE